MHADALRSTGGHRLTPAGTDLHLLQRSLEPLVAAELDPEVQRVLLHRLRQLVHDQLVPRSYVGRVHVAHRTGVEACIGLVQGLQQDAEVIRDDPNSTQPVRRSARSQHPPAPCHEARRRSRCLPTSARLHPVPVVPHTVAFVTTRVVPGNTPMVMFESGQYSVPHTLVGAMVWVRPQGVGADEQVVIVHVSEDGPVEVARHARATPGTPKINDEHFPPQPEGPLDRRPRARNAAEAEFLDLGAGARLWLVEAAAAGTTKMRGKMAEALSPAKPFDPVEVDWALGHAAVHGRFAEADLSSILDHHARARNAGKHRASEESSLTQGTSAWARLGQRGGDEVVR
jgi:hypothetical protein